MDDILDTLLQTIEESAFPLFYAKSEYRRMQYCVEEHMQWLQEHLDDEGKAHLEQVKRAEFDMASLEREALVRTAISVGIQFALPG